MFDYPFHKCLHPRVVVNPNNGKEVVTCCGICKACLMNRANKASFLCALEEKDHKYCFFVTLTYSNEHVPLMKPVRYESAGISGWLLKNCCDRLLDEYGEYLGFDDDRIHKDSSYMSMLTNKCCLKGYLGYANNRDVDLFLKRFRKNLKQYSNEKIRYYAVSEYGPRTFRPHYHLLFYFEQKETLEGFLKTLSQSWQYGRVDASTSRGGCSSYVARYVNSNYSLPPLFALRSLRPFAHHSIGFAKGFYLSQKKEIYENEPERFINQCRGVGSRVVEFMPWRSLTSTFFPRCQGYNDKSYDELLYSYTILPRAYERYGKLPISTLSEAIYKDLVYHYDSDKHFAFYDFFLKENEFRLRQSRSYKSWLSKISGQLYISKHFIEFVCETDYDISSSSNWQIWIKYLNKIVHFYDRYNYSMLTGMYRKQQEYYNTYNDFLGYCYFYDNFPMDIFKDIYDLFSGFPTRPQFELACCRYYDFHVTDFIHSIGMTYWEVLNSPSFKNSKVYTDFVVNTSHKFNDSIKHKELNDLNNYFIYY